MLEQRGCKAAAMNHAPRYPWPCRNPPHSEPGLTSVTHFNQDNVTEVMQSVPNLCLRKAAWALWSPWAAKFPGTNPAREIMWSCHMGNKGPEMSRDFVERAPQISLAFPPSPPRCQGAVWMCPGAPDDCCLH